MVFLHVEDAANAYVKCLETPLYQIKGEIFNIGFFNYPISGIANLIKVLMPDTIVSYDKNKPDPRNYNVSFEKAKRILNIPPKFNVEKGIYEIKKQMNRFSNYQDKRYNNYNSLRDVS